MDFYRKWTICIKKWSISRKNCKLSQIKKAYFSPILKSLKDKLGEENIKRFVNFCLKYLSEIEIPVKRFIVSIKKEIDHKFRGTFIEYRNGMINVSPIGRNCSQEERDAFEIYDKVIKIFLFGILF